MKMVSTINEAYPYKDDERKIVDKKEKVYNPLGDGAWHDWGDVSVSKLQKKINCVVCQNYILDRYEEVPFFYCLRCKREEREGKHLEMCISCWNNGALATGPRDKIALVKGDDTEQKGRDSFAGGKLSGDVNMGRKSITADAQAMRGRNSQGGALQARVAERASRTAGLNISPRSDDEGRRPSKERKPQPTMLTGGCRPHSTIPCGLWKGRVTEGASGRPVEFKFFFDESGEVSGNGPDNCEVKGTISGPTSNKVTWKEKHDWGTIDVTADMKENYRKIVGKFKASDGGGGALELIPISPRGGTPNPGLKRGATSGF